MKMKDIDWNNKAPFTKEQIAEINKKSKRNAIIRDNINQSKQSNERQLKNKVFLPGIDSEMLTGTFFKNVSK